MKYSAVILALAATTLATTTKDLPSCSRKTLEQGVLAGGCKTNDFACSCDRADILAPILLPLVQQVCNNADVDRAITVIEGICLHAGIPVTIPRPSPIASIPVPVHTSSPIHSIIRSSSSLHLPTPSSVRPRPSSSSRVPDISISLPVPTPSLTTITISEPLPTPILPSSASTCSLITVTQTVTLRLPPLPSASSSTINIIPSIPIPSIIVPPYPTTNATAPLPTGTNPAVTLSSEVPVIVVPSSTGPVGTVVVPSVKPSAVTSGVPAFTGAAVMGVKVPAVGVVGLVGFAAALL